MTRIVCERIEAQAGTAFAVKRGDIIRVIDPKGEQVSDMVAFTTTSPRGWLSSGKSIDYAGRLYLTTGDILYSNKSEPLLTILDDKVRKHDFLLAPCSQEMFDLLYEGQTGHHPSCFGNLSRALEKFGIDDNEIPVAFNIFMNVNIGKTGEIIIEPPMSQPGDYIELRAECDLVVGLTACSAEKTNNGALKPIDFEVHRDS